jgi:hypothetical protein
LEEDLRHTANRLTGVTLNGQTVNYGYTDVMDCQ